MKGALPAGPFIVLIISAGLLLAGLSLRGAPALKVRAALPVVPQISGTATENTFGDPREKWQGQSAVFQTEILRRSPFSAKRSAFFRADPGAVPTVPAYKPKLLGLITAEGRPLAIVQWTPDAPPQEVARDEVTEWGTILQIGSASVSVATGDSEYDIHLFETELDN